MTNLEAADEMLAAMEDLGRLNQIDRARVVALRSLAEAVDRDPGNASLWREYRAAEAALREFDDGADDYADLLDALSAKAADPEE